MDEMSSNSRLSKETKQSEHKLDSVVSKKPTVTKRKGARKLADTFLQDDIENVKSYVVSDVIIPTIKELIFNTISNTISMLMFGDARGASSFNNRSRPQTRVSYSRYYDQGRRTEPERETRRSGFDYDDITFDNRGDAERVLAAMDEAVDRYGVLSIFDMYDLAGVDAPYTYQNYGWTNIRNARVIQSRGYYIIDMPRALPIR